MSSDGSGGGRVCPKGGLLKVNGTAIEGAAFTVPDEDVVIAAEFVSEAEDLVAAPSSSRETLAEKAEEARIAAEEARGPPRPPPLSADGKESRGSRHAEAAGTRPYSRSDFRY